MLKICFTLVLFSSYYAFCQKKIEASKTTIHLTDTLVFLNHSMEPVNGMVFEDFSDGKRKYEKNYLNGKLHGTTKSWYENEQMESELNWKNGELVGLSRRWYLNGQLFMKGLFENTTISVESWYENGQIESISTPKDKFGKSKSSYWYPNGKIENELNFKNNKQDGIQKFWYDNGQLKREGFLVDGKIDGAAKFWTPDGFLYYEHIYSMGQKNGVCKTWQSDGRYIEEIWDKDLVVRQKVFQNDILIAEFNFSGGKPDGTHTIWDNSGKRLILQENYKNGQYDGSQKLWHENGQLTRELNYSTGKKIGWQRYFDITGKSLGETNLIEGNGKVFVKYPNGQRELEEVYQNGLMSGLQKSWYQNGQLSTEYNFEDGKRVGFQHAYNENGELKIEGNLIDGNGVLKENDRNRESNYEWEFKDGYLINMASINWTGNQINFKDGNISELTYGYDGELVSYIAETKIMGNILIREDKPEIEGEVGDRSEITVKIIDGNVLYGYSLDEICMFTENKNCFIIKKICFNEYNEMIKCSE